MRLFLEFRNQRTFDYFCAATECIAVSDGYRQQLEPTSDFLSFSFLLSARSCLVTNGEFGSETLEHGTVRSTFYKLRNIGICIEDVCLKYIKHSIVPSVLMWSSFLDFRNSTYSSNLHPILISFQASLSLLYYTNRRNHQRNFSSVE